MKDSRQADFQPHGAALAVGTHFNGHEDADGASEESYPSTIVHRRFLLSRGDAA